MAYVTVPKDLDRVKNKVVLNLTLRQIICIGAGGLVGVPFYFATKDVIGSTAAATGMVLIMLPAFFFAMYEKDGQPLEKLLWNMWMVKHVRPKERRREAARNDRKGGKDGKREAVSVAEDRKNIRTGKHPV